MGGIGLVAGLALRALMAGLLVHVLRAGSEDHRFRAKGIVSRAVVIVPISTLTMPLLWATRGRRGPYPHGMDCLFMSITALDLAGNVLDLYDRHRHFDLIPHAHGTGALTVILAWLLRVPMRRAIAIATLGHVLLEGQEIASDVLFGYRNVRGWWDSAGDLGSGLVGSAVYAGAYLRLVRQTGHEPSSPLAPTLDQPVALAGSRSRRPRAMSAPATRPVTATTTKK